MSVREQKLSSEFEGSVCVAESQSVVPAIVQVTRPVTRPHVLILAHLLPPPSLALNSYSTYRTYCTYYSVPRS